MRMIVVSGMLLAYWMTQVVESIRPAFPVDGLQTPRTGTPLSRAQMDAPVLGANSSLASAAAYRRFRAAPTVTDLLYRVLMLVPVGSAEPPAAQPAWVLSGPGAILNAAVQVRKTVRVSVAGGVGADPAALYSRLITVSAIQPARVVMRVESAVDDVALVTRRTAAATNCARWMVMIVVASATQKQPAALRETSPDWLVET